MRKLFLIIIALLSAAPLSAEKPGSVSLRYGRQDQTIRIVIESSDEFIKKAVPTSSSSAITIAFPEAFEMKKQQDFMFETTSKDRVFTIILKDVSDISYHRLTSPSRIVFDLKTVQKPSKETSAQPEVKPVKDPAGQPAAPKTPQQAVQPAEKTSRIRTVVVDPGHGGYDNGITSRDIKEKDLNLGLARDISAFLAKKGVSVHMTRRSDQAVPITERISSASGKKPDIFISVHATPSDNFSVYMAAAEDQGTDPGVRIYSLSAKQAKHLEKSRYLANAVASSLGKEFSSPVATRELPLPVLNSSDAPSILIEYPMSGKYTYDQKMRDRLVKALIHGLEVYER